MTPTRAAPHFLTADGDLVRPALDISKGDRGFQRAFDAGGFQRFLDAAFA